MLDPSSPQGLLFDLDGVLFVGDDVGGAQAVGLAGVLVRTGKFSESWLESSPVTPDLVVNDVADLARRMS